MFRLTTPEYIMKYSSQMLAPKLRILMSAKLQMQAHAGVLCGNSNTTSWDAFSSVIFSSDEQLL